MNVKGITALVTGGASGLGLATVKHLAELGAAHVVMVDLPNPDGDTIAAQVGDNVHFVAGDVRDEVAMAEAVATAENLGNFRATVHCAGRGGPVRVLDRDGNPGSLQAYSDVININLIGSFNVLRLSAAAMNRNEPINGERGVVIMTASIAAYEGQIGQIPYASSKAGVVGMTIVAARDLASKGIRVNTIAPGLFETPILDKLRPEVKEALQSNIPNPPRFGQPDEFALMASQIIANPMLNGETIRLDGALRMAPR